MKIGLDLDATLVGIAFEEQKILDTFRIKEYPHDWSFSNYPNEVKNAIFEMFNDAEIMCNLKPFTGVNEKLKTWQKQGYELVVITARSDKIKDRTIEYVQDLFNLPCVVTNSFNKIKAFADSAIDIWIDDHPENVIIAEELGIKSYLISNDTTPYNYCARKEVEFVPSIVNLPDTF